MGTVNDLSDTPYLINAPCLGQSHTADLYVARKALLDITENGSLLVDYALQGALKGIMPKVLGMTFLTQLIFWFFLVVKMNLSCANKAGVLMTP